MAPEARSVGESVEQHNRESLAVVANLKTQLADLDQLSFQITGPLVTAIVRQRPMATSSPTEIQLLFQFHDGFGAHIPQLIFTEFPAPNELAAATVQAMRMIPNLLSART